MVSDRSSMMKSCSSVAGTIERKIAVYASLQLEIVNLLEMLNRLHERPEHELLTLSQKNTQLIEEVAAQQWKAISDEIAAFNEEAARLQREIDELTVGVVPRSMSDEDHKKYNESLRRRRAR